MDLLVTVEDAVVGPSPTARNLGVILQFIFAVYVPPSADKQTAMTELDDNISQLQTAHPEALYIVAGDFNVFKECVT